MTSHDPASPDPRDPFEQRLGARLRGLSDRAVRPVDASALAHAASVEAGRTGLGSRLRSRLGATGTAGRLGWLLVGAVLLAVLVVGGASLGGGALFGLLTPATSTSPTTAAATLAPTTAPGPVAGCLAGDLSASVLRWTGAAGSRIADVRLRNDGSSPCSLATLARPQLIDGHRVLIDGDAPAPGGTITLTAGGTATTEVEDANYCGPDPVAPISVAFVLSNGDRVVAEALSPADLSGVAPCNGPSEPGMVTMQPWVR